MTDDAGLVDGVLAAYEGFAKRVDPFSERASQRADVHCRRGCSSCCVAGLSVSAVEATRLRHALGALDEATREKVRDQHAKRTECVLLVDDACVVYEARPMVCRTQGLPLAYESGTIPPERLSARAADGRDVTWCPLNYTSAPPNAAEIVDASAIDTGVATLNRAYTSITGDDALSRVTLADLAGESG